MTTKIVAPCGKLPLFYYHDFNLPQKIFSVGSQLFQKIRKNTFFQNLNHDFLWMAAAAGLLCLTNWNMGHVLVAMVETY